MVIISFSVVVGFSGLVILSAVSGAVSIPDEVIFLAVGAALESANTKMALIKEVNSMGRGIIIIIIIINNNISSSSRNKTIQTLNIVSSWAYIETFENDELQVR